MSAWLDGWRRVLRAPVLVAGVYFMTVLSAAPLAWAMRDVLRTALGRSTAAASMADGVNWDWWQEFLSQTSGLGTTLQPQIIGFAATLDNLGSILDRQGEAVLVLGAVAVYMVAWTFAAGGIIDRYARQRPTRGRGFFAACGVHVFRFLRLAVVAGGVYAFLFSVVHPRLFTRWYADAVADVSSEREAFFWRLLMYALFAALLGAANLLFDYTRIRLVVEDRRSVLGALLAAVRFVRRFPARTSGLYLANTLTFLLAAAAWALLAPGAGGSGWVVFLVFAAGQLFILARLMLKLHFLASQTALFQQSLAHAAYTAAPDPQWPESAAAELIAGG